MESTLTHQTLSLCLSSCIREGRGCNFFPATCCSRQSPSVPSACGFFWGNWFLLALLFFPSRSSLFLETAFPPPPFTRFPVSASSPTDRALQSRVGSSKKVSSFQLRPSLPASNCPPPLLLFLRAAAAAPLLNSFSLILEVITFHPGGDGFAQDEAETDDATKASKAIFLSNPSQHRETLSANLSCPLPLQPSPCSG